MSLGIQNGPLMPRDSFYWGTTKWTWDLGGGSNINGARVRHTRTRRGAVENRRSSRRTFRHLDHMFMIV